MAAPINPKPYKSEKPWRDALLRAVNRRFEGTGDPKALDKIADKVVASAIAGDMQAAKEIGDRLDGKAHQSIAAEVSGDMKIVVATGVPRADG